MKRKGQGVFVPWPLECDHNGRTALGMHEGAAAPSYEIRSGGMYGAMDRSRARPVGDEARRSVGNRKECRLRHDYASFPEERKPLPLSFGVCPKGAREMM